jgi:hypothetical protein
MRLHAILCSDGRACFALDRVVLGEWLCADRIKPLVLIGGALPALTVLSRTNVRPESDDGSIRWR